MARTEQKVESLIEENPDLADALVTILERTDGGQGEVEWADVRDNLSSGEWGRLIETGVLIDGEEGFELSNPEGVLEVLEDDDRVAAAARRAANAEAQEQTEAAIEGDIDDDVEWTTWDKVAAGGAVALFAGYSMNSIRNVIGSTINVFLGPLDTLLPFYIVILVLSVLTGLYSTLLQANLMDMDKMSAYQQRMKDIQRRQKEAKERGDDEEVERIRQEQMEAMGDQLGLFKVQFRPMVWIMLLTIPVFLWMFWMIGEGRIGEFENQIVIPLAGAATWTESIIGPIQLWIVWYFLCSMAFTQIIRKALNIQTTPT